MVGWLGVGCCVDDDKRMSFVVGSLPIIVSAPQRQSQTSRVTLITKPLGMRSFVIAFLQSGDEGGEKRGGTQGASKPDDE